jgi:hypothetical protein
LTEGVQGTVIGLLKKLQMKSFRTSTRPMSMTDESYNSLIGTIQTISSSAQFVSKTPVFDTLSETTVDFEYQWLAQQGVPEVVHQVGGSSLEVYNPEMSRLDIITDNLVKIAQQQVVKMAT